MDTKEKIVLCLKEALTNQIFDVNDIKLPTLCSTKEEEEVALRILDAFEALENHPNDESILKGIRAILAWQQIKFLYKDDAATRLDRTGLLL